MGGANAQLIEALYVRVRVCVRLCVNFGLEINKKKQIK